MTFKKRFIPEGENIFEEIKSVRKKYGVSLSAISQKTKIPIKYLRSLEAGSLKELPDILYTKNIIKKYFSFLNLDPTPFLSKIKIERTVKKSPNKAIGLKSMIIMPRIIKTLIGIIFVFIFLIYLVFSINNVFNPPKITIYAPQENETVTTHIINIVGKAESGTKIFINNEQVILEKDNTFNQEVNLQKGLNLIKISGINRYSKENIIWRNVILEIN